MLNIDKTFLLRGERNVCAVWRAQFMVKEEQEIEKDSISYSFGFINRCTAIGSRSHH